MAKATSEDSFNVHILGVPLERLGPLMAQLAREGFSDVRNELVTTVRTFARNTAPIDGINGDQFMRAWLADHPTFRAVEAVRHFEANGRTKGSAYPLLSKLVAEGVLIKNGPGHYSRADVKQIEGPTKKAAATPKLKVRADAALLTIARRNHGRFTSALAKKHFAVQGRPPTGVGPTIARLMREKLIRRTGSGSYELTAKGEDGGKLPKVRAKANGAHPPIDQVAEPATEA